jgi:hypothetical protein
VVFKEAPPLSLSFHHAHVLYSTERFSGASKFVSLYFAREPLLKFYYHNTCVNKRRREYYNFREHQLHAAAAAATVNVRRLPAIFIRREKELLSLSINLWYFERQPASLFNLNPTGNTKKPSLLPLNH